MFNEDVYFRHRQMGKDPCNGYYDLERNNCAICLQNELRIMLNVTYYDSSGWMVEMNKVVCGSVREPDRDSTTHAYSFMNPDTVTQDE